MQTILEGPTTWTAICALSRAMTNGADRDSFRADLAYMATDSVGGRRVGAPAKPVHVVDADFGMHRGYDERSISSLEWVSASSNAVIRAWPVASSGWWLRYEGPPAGGRESGYLEDFLCAVLPDCRRYADAIDHHALDRARQRGAGRYVLPTYCATCGWSMPDGQLVRRWHASPARCADGACRGED